MLGQALLCHLSLQVNLRSFSQFQPGARLMLAREQPLAGAPQLTQFSFQGNLSLMEVRYTT